MNANALTMISMNKHPAPSLCLQFYPDPSRVPRSCRVATPSSLQLQENVALVVVYSALMALAWLDTVPDNVSFEPFAGLLCDVMLTT